VVRPRPSAPATNRWSFYHPEDRATQFSIGYSEKDSERFNAEDIINSYNREHKESFSMKQAVVIAATMLISNPTSRSPARPSASIRRTSWYRSVTKAQDTYKKACVAHSQDQRQTA